MQQPQNEKARLVTGPNQNHNPSGSYQDSNIQIFLSRLDHAQQYGKGYRARCPAHGSDRNRSLSIAVADDGRMLLKCFAGCSALDVVHAIGLELKDLFPARIAANMTPAERRQLRQLAKQSQWAAALEVLTLEARIVAVAADQIAQAEPLNDPDRDRLGLALERITSARMVLT